MDASAEWLMGLIWATFFGLAMGNYATNPIYRLPRNETLFGRTPYCGDCNAELKPKDLFPIFSWLSTWGKCRYCKAPVPVAYVIAEALITVLFVRLYVLHGFSEWFIVLGLALTAVVMLVMMQVIDCWFSDKTWVFLLALGAVARTLQEGTIYGFLQGVFVTGLIAVLYGKWLQKYRPNESYFPVEAKLLLLAGLWFGLHAFALCVLVWGVTEICIRVIAQSRPNIRSIFPITASFAAGFSAPFLLPAWNGVIKYILQLQ